MLRKSDDPIKEELKELLGKEFQSLSSADKQAVCELYKNKKKSDLIILFWFLSLHYAYVKEWKLFLLFAVSLGGFAIWWVIDFFRLDTILKEYNKKLAKEILLNIEKA